jgi:hypothetical protein
MTAPDRPLIYTMVRKGKSISIVLNPRIKEPLPLSDILDVIVKPLYDAEGEKISDFTPEIDGAN